MKGKRFRISDPARINSNSPYHEGLIGIFAGYVNTDQMFGKIIPVNADGKNVINGNLYKFLINKFDRIPRDEFLLVKLENT